MTTTMTGNKGIVRRSKSMAKERYEKKHEETKRNNKGEKRKQ